MAEAVIVEAVRSPVGKRNGGLSGVHPGELSAQVLNGLAERAGIDPEIGDCVLGGDAGSLSFNRRSVTNVICANTPPLRMARPFLSWKIIR